MESESDYTDMALSNGFSEIRLSKSKTVRELLKELGLLHRHFVVLVDVKRVSLEDAIEEGQRVIVLPIIAGG